MAEFCAANSLKDPYPNSEEIIFSEPNNPNSIANAILYVYNNKDLCKKIGKNGHYWALNNLNYLKNGEKLINFIKR